jgi:hypothetical protein
MEVTLGCTVLQVTDRTVGCQQLACCAIWGCLREDAC